MGDLDEYVATLPDDVSSYLLKFPYWTSDWYVTKRFPTKRGVHLRAARRGLVRVAHKTKDCKVLRLTDLGSDVRRALGDIRRASKAMEGIET